jgi:glucose-6-phosphate isomerase
MAKTKVYTMTKRNQCLTDYPEWRALDAHCQLIAHTHMREWFQRDHDRFSSLSINNGNLLLDYSRNRIDQKTIDLLVALANATELPKKIAALFDGHPINITENRAALHTALRDKTGTPFIVDGNNITALISENLDKMRAFTTAVHTQQITGATGKPIQHIVTIGVGGSYLGTMMACHALADFCVDKLQFHFIASIDKALTDDVLKKIDAETTLFIISSKTFTTLETMTNAKSLLAWMRQKVGDQAATKHFIAITAATDKAVALGINPAYIFPMWDWVGGRYSIWSAIGLPLMLMIGSDQFDAFLAGAHEMDMHFKQTSIAKNMPVLLALLSIWYMNFFHANAQAIVPYSHRLRYLIPYLQQADMESNGKRTSLTGDMLTYTTGPVIFGEEGCNGQHSYHQLLHQGQHLIPVDFILIGKPFHQSQDDQHDILLASGLSQAQALMQGKTSDEAMRALLSAGHSPDDAAFLAKHQANPGNRPSNIIFLNQLTPKNLGALIALYEHKIFVQGAIWNINSFDQWGVELGKQLLADILHCVQGKNTAPVDTDTAGIIQHLKSIKGQA